jgi:hypothetical protein
MLEIILLTCLSLVLQYLPRISAEVPESFSPKRILSDDVDTNPYTVGNIHKMARRTPDSPVTLLHLTLPGLGPLVPAMTTIVLCLRYLTHLLYLVLSL